MIFSIFYISFIHMYTYVTYDVHACIYTIIHKYIHEYNVYEAEKCKLKITDEVIAGGRVCNVHYRKMLSIYCIFYTLGLCNIIYMLHIYIHICLQQYFTCSGSIKLMYSPIFYHYISVFLYTYIRIII